ncbi:MAG: hypothetical protein JNJ83_03585 [Verrucomicrobiaceae bacterium]|nr:hypothetical protein [Verrucomicrobiaceae bacterium]
MKPSSEAEVKRSESAAHMWLKEAALAWAVEAGYDVAAKEVRIPRSSYRADVVALKTTLKGGTKITRTVIFECKKSRADLIKDSRSVQKTLVQLRELEARKHKLDTLLGTHYPSLRTSDELFNEFTVPVDVQSLGHQGYAETTKKIEVLKNRLYGKTKFDKLIHYQNADLHYLVTTSGLLETHEVPAGWGHLEQENEHLTLKKQPELCQADDSKRLEMLISVARRAARLAHSSSTGITSTAT